MNTKAHAAAKAAMIASILAETALVQSGEWEREYECKPDMSEFRDLGFEEANEAARQAGATDDELGEIYEALSTDPDVQVELDKLHAACEAA